MTAQASEIQLLPGERLVAGRPYCFDMEARLDFLAQRAKAEAPADLTTLTDEALMDLKFAAMRVWSMSGGRDDYLLQVSAEARRRGFDSASRRVQAMEAA